MTIATDHAGFFRAGLDAIDDFMESYVTEGKTAGMLTLVSRNGEIGHLSCRGYADIESATPIREDTIFRIYSMTKPIASVAMMQLLERGLFELDDAASRWIPALAKMKVYPDEPLDSAITIRQLLTHTAGFSYGFEPDTNPVDKHYAHIWDPAIKARPLREVLPEMFECPLFAQPGSRWHYSIATDICGYLVELISDMSFADYLQQNIFDPLGMVDTAFEVAADKVDRFATLYGLRDDDPLAQLELRETSSYIPSLSGMPVKLHSGGAGLISTARDYWHFAQMMLNRGEFDGRRILEPATVELMTQNHVDTRLLPLEINGVAPGDFDGYGFGLGYSINLDPARTAAAGSRGDFGWGGLADTYCWVDPQQQLVAILMQQYLPSMTHAGRKDFRNAVYRALS